MCLFILCLSSSFSFSFPFAFSFDLSNPLSLCMCLLLYLPSSLSLPLSFFIVSSLSFLSASFFSSSFSFPSSFLDSLSLSLPLSQEDEQEQKHAKQNKVNPPKVRSSILEGGTKRNTSCLGLGSTTESSQTVAQTKSKSKQEPIVFSSLCQWSRDRTRCEAESVRGGLSTCGRCASLVFVGHSVNSPCPSQMN